MPPNLAPDFDHLHDQPSRAKDDDSSSAKVLRCALLGCGMMGQEHISYMAGYPDKVRLEYFCDPHQPSIEASLHMLQKYRSDPDPLDTPFGQQQHQRQQLYQPPKIFHSEDELFRNASDRIDLLVIATPNYMHCDTIVRWSHLPHLTILCEKPVAVSQEQHDTLVALRDSGRLLARVWIAMEYRFIPAVARVLDLLSRPVDSPDNVVGHIKMITIRENRYPFLHKVGAWNRKPSQTGDTLVEKCCHFFDLFRLLANQEVDLSHVQAMAQRGINYQDEKTRDDDDDEDPIIDAAYVMFPMKPRGNQNHHEHFNSRQTSSPAIMACLELCMYAEGSRHQEEIIVTGTKGRLEAYLPENKVYAYRRPTHETWKDRSIPPPPTSPIVYDCSDVAAVHGIDDETIPTHGGYHYSSTAVEWYRLLRAISLYDQSRQNHEHPRSWQPDVSLSDGLAAVQIGLQATKALRKEDNTV